MAGIPLALRSPSGLRSNRALCCIGRQDKFHETERLRFPVRDQQSVLWRSRVYK